jgi:hypothetical protein
MGGMCLLACLFLAGCADLPPVRYTYAYPYAWGGWKPSDEWVRRDIYGRPFYLGWRWSDRLHEALPYLSHRPPRLAVPGHLPGPGHLPPGAEGLPLDVPPKHAEPGASGGSIAPPMTPIEVCPPTPYTPGSPTSRLNR